MSEGPSESASPRDGTTEDSVREFTVHASGHEHVSAEHESTFELTSDDWLTPAGDCILGVEADTTPADVPESFLAACRSRDARITVELSAAGVTDRVAGTGHPDLTYADDRSMVARTSEYVDDRTVLVNADAAAADLSRKLVTALERGAPLTATVRVHSE